MATQTEGVKGRGELPARVLAAQLGLSEAFERVRANNGMAGADGVTVARFARQAAANLRALQAGLANGSYVPWPLRLCETSKKSGLSSRMLLIPVVGDRVIQTAVAQWIGPRFEKEADPSSYAYRPGRGVADALRALRSLREQGFRWVLDADIRGFFDNIDHELLLGRLREWLGAGSAMVQWVALWLRGPVWDGTGLDRLEGGVAQGSPLSPVLANLYLDVFDRRLRSGGLRFIRYADDFLVLARSPFELEEIRRTIERELAGLRLELSGDKTRATSFGAAFRFLGAEVKDEAILLPFEKPRPEKKPIFVAPPMPPAIQALYRRGHWGAYPPFVWQPRPVEVEDEDERAQVTGDPRVYDALRKVVR